MILDTRYEKVREGGEVLVRATARLNCAVLIAVGGRAVFTSIPWQRCQFHLQQNAQSYITTQDMKKGIASRIRAIFNAPSREEAERLNKEVNRRTRVVGIFPNPESCLRLVTAVLMKMSEE